MHAASSLRLQLTLPLRYLLHLSYGFIDLVENTDQIGQETEGKVVMWATNQLCSSYHHYNKILLTKYPTET